MKKIPYGRQNITDEDISAVVHILKSDNLTQGPTIKEFENKFAEYIGSNYAVAVANGTAALHLCTLAMGVKEGDKVITTPLTFAASANCIRYCGVEVVFADIDPSSYLLDIENVRELLKSSPKGTYKGIIPVDFAGQAVNLEAFRKLADEYGLWIIEDSCHSPGGYFIDSEGNKQHCGNGNFADLAIFSFHPVKHIATGEGGMITTNNEDLYHKLMKLRTHGIVKSNDLYSNSIEFAGGTNTYPLWYMEMQDLGFNYRITEFQAALGLSQLKRLDQIVMRRTENLHYFLNQLNPSKFYTDFKLEGSSNYAFNVVLKDADPELADRLMHAMRQNGIEFRRGSAGGGNQIRQPYLKGTVPDNHHLQFPNVEHIHFYGFYIGNFPNLTKNEIDEICSIINAV